MNELQKIFQYDGKSVRTAMISDIPVMCAKDICELLDIIWNGAATLQRVGERHKGVTKFPTPSGDQDMFYVDEAGFYKLAMRSNKPDAERVQDWIAEEVLPAIRKHGGYLTAEKIEEVLLNPDTIIRLATDLKSEREKVRRLEEKRKEDAPKVLFADSVAASHTNILIGELAKILKQNGLDIGQNRLFEWLRQRGYLINRRGTDYNMPTQKAMEMELFIIKETTINKPDGSIHISKTVKVTGKGQVYFVNRLITKTA